MKPNNLKTLAGMALLLMACNNSSTQVRLDTPRAPGLTTQGWSAIATPAIQRNGDYDYAASIIDTGNERQVWWCGGSRTASLTNEAVADPDYPYSDGIIYAKYNKSTGQVLEAPRTVLFSKPNANAWDRSYVCDPSVVKGVFSYNSTNYSYALYYTATDRGPGSSYSPDPAYTKPKNTVDPVKKDFDGTNNRIGVAFSNDGKTWVRYANNPIIFPITRKSPPSTTEANSTDAYGAGQSATQNTNGTAGIWMVHTDTSDAQNPCNVNRVYLRKSTNGITFGAPQEVSRSGLIGPNTFLANGDFSFDPTGHYWYGVFRMDSDTRPGAWLNTYGDIYRNAFNGCRKVNTASLEFSQNPLRAEDRESYQLGVYRMPEAQFPTGTWEVVGYISTNSVGYPINHSPGFARDLYGNVNYGAGLEVMFSSGTNVVSDWDLRTLTVNNNPSTVPLKRYFGTTYGYHTVTTGFVGTDDTWTLEATLGHLKLGRSTAEGTTTVPLYGCQAGSKDSLTRDRFVSRDAACEGQYPLGINGFIYQQPPSGVASVPLYRCKTVKDHFVSTQANCEGQTVEQLLGYARVNP